MEEREGHNTEQFKQYEITCPDCLKLQKELIDADRNKIISEIRNIFDEKLQTSSNITKTIKRQESILWIYAGLFAFVIIVLIFLYNSYSELKIIIQNL